MRYYCTYFDHRYLPRGLALYESLLRHGGTFELWVLCLSEECDQALQKLGLPHLKILSMSEFEAGDIPLLAAKQNRSPIEYFFTCTPSFMRFLFKKVPAMDAVTYLDADLYFFGDAEDVHAEIGGASIAITPHRFPAAIRHAERYGIYNVGWLTFRRDANAFACLEWWRERCLEWCYDREEDGRFADQKYLDCWPAKFTGVKVIEHPGVNLAPWNLSGARLEWEHGRVWVDGKPVLVFHFHGLKQLSRRIFDPQWNRYLVKPERILKRRIYRPYLEHLLSLAERLNIKEEFAGVNSRITDEAPLSSDQATQEPVKKWKQTRELILKDTYLHCENFPRKPYPVGVVLPIFDSADALKDHLIAMEKWVDLVQEIVVVDNQAGDGTAEFIQEQLQHPGLRIVSSQKGLYESWNCGIGQITSEYTYISRVGDLITRKGLKHLVLPAKRLDCDLLVSVPRLVNTQAEVHWSVPCPIQNIIDDLRISEPCLLSKPCAFSRAVDYALHQGLQAIVDNPSSNLYRTEMMKRFPFPTDYGSSGELVWGVRHALEIAFAVSPVCHLESMIQEKQLPPDTAQMNAQTVQNLAREMRAIILQQMETGADEVRVSFKWIKTVKEYARARSTLAQYRSRRWPWYLRQRAWRARSLVKRGPKEIDSLRRQMEPYFTDCSIDDFYTLLQDFVTTVDK